MGVSDRSDWIPGLTEIFGSQSKFRGASPDMVPWVSELKLDLEMGTHLWRVNAIMVQRSVQPKQCLSAKIS